VIREATVTVMSAHPLSASFRESIESDVGVPPHYLLVSTLRRLGLLGAARELLRLRPDVLILACEDADSEVLRPLLKAMALATRAARIESLDASLERRRESRLAAVMALVDVALASVASLAAYARARLELRRLLAAEAVPMTARAGGGVLYLNTNLWFGVKAGGSVGHIAGVANEMQRRGQQVCYAAASDSAQIDVDVVRWPLTPPRSYGLPPELNLYRFGLSARRQVARLCAERRPSIIYQRMSVCDYTGVLLSRMLRVPLVLEYNGSEVWTARHWGRPMIFEALATAAEQASLRHAHLLVTVSDALGDQLLAAGVPREKIVVYPNCVDPMAYDPTRFSPDDRGRLLGELGWSSEDVVVGFIGTFGQWHGVEVLAEAIRLVLDSDDSWVGSTRLRFLLVGDGQGMPRVREILGVHADGPRVRLTGLVAQGEAAAYLAVCDILASPHVPNPDGSAFFGSPTKLFEYMAMGRAIIASDLDQIGAVLAPSVRVESLPEGAPTPGGESLAVLTKPGSVEDLIQGIQFLAENREWRSHLGANARGEVLRRYTWTHHVTAILDRLHGAGQRSQPDHDLSD
jgi:glycosyltransferase involved in cell wall biosynthesis